MKKTRTYLSTIAIIALSLALTGCSSDAKKAEGGESIADAASAFTIELNGSSDENTAGPLQSVFFEFDSSSLTSESKAMLEENATWLKGIEAVTIQIEGHADERGGVQYNLALGERRAKSVVNFLAALGVSEDRISMISYGKERPRSFGHDESSWGQNRRANFVITAK